MAPHVLGFVFFQKKHIHHFTGAPFLVTVYVEMFSSVSLDLVEIQLFLPAAHSIL